MPREEVDGTGRAGVARTLLATAAAWGGTHVARRALDRWTGDARWTRVNHRGEPVSLLAGPAVAAGLAGAGLAARAAGAGPVATAGLVAACGGAAFGLVDDLAEDTSRRRKGLRGHLGALAHGELTTGGLKVLGIGATSLVAAAVLHRPWRPGGRPGALLDTVTSGALVAATANLVNLLDLRPGRALKAAGLAALPAAGGPGGVAAGAVLGASAAALPHDLAETDMLGDGGANALGAALGVAAVAAAPRPVRLGLLAGAVALTVASERVSFTEVIARTPVLRELDAWGRR